MLPKSWLVSDLERQFLELALEVEALRQRTVCMQAVIEAQGKQLMALRKRIAEQRPRQTSSGSSMPQRTSLAMRTHS